MMKRAHTAKGITLGVAVLLALALALPALAEFALPSIFPQDVSVITAGEDVAAYTGPGEEYYRSANGKAAIQANAEVTVYGRTGDWLLVEYKAKLGGKPITRFAFVPAQRVGNADTFEELALGELTMNIKPAGKVADAPDASRDGFDGITISRNKATLLATVFDANNNPWFYFETTGFSKADGRQIKVRGFVQPQDIVLLTK